MLTHLQNFVKGGVLADHIGNAKLRILAIQLTTDRACLEVLKLSLPS